jgi:dipeptidyl aminopeptidase/acylaminoacyl peptidase
VIFSSKPYGPLQHFCWLSDSQSFAYVRAEKDFFVVEVRSLRDGSIRQLELRLKNLANVWWSPRGDYFLYSKEAPSDQEENGVRFIRAIVDRTALARRFHGLTMVQMASATCQPLTDEREDFSQVVISPDGRKAILVSTSEDAGRRPYVINNFFLLDMSSLVRQPLFESGWVRQVCWSPDARRLLCLGGPSAFAGLGRNVKGDGAVNDYDLQAYVYDIASKKPEAISRRFLPSIRKAWWNSGDGRIYVQVNDRDYIRLYRYQEEDKAFRQLETPVAVVSEMTVADVPQAVFCGSGLAQPPQLYALDLASGKCRKLKDYNHGFLAGVKFGRVENWSFRNGDGKTIDGFLILPPTFRAERRYPCIVRYYGGTEPVTREFGGRFPLDWYAANGYVVCVIQPSGAIGWGQEFSARHVNDWGETSAAEIIAGVKELLRTHAFIDPARVGAIGQSYGGFLTQYLATQTDLFAAYVSHAGISSLASYWGSGDWGYNYSAVASADSFPWNRKDLYVGHSPLFMAERIQKPLLLLHGLEDNNVPAGESYQMHTALKLLGKEVALITFAGEKHSIQDYGRRRQWLRTIIAWFDRWLKGEAEMWNSLYGQ